jgi:CheY-like chemotaxis protein
MTLSNTFYKELNRLTLKKHSMNTQSTNLFIVDDNPLVVTGLKSFLINKFGGSLNIQTFNTGASAIKEVNKDTCIVILDYYLKNENGNDVLKAIKVINPKTEVIMLTSNEDMAVAIDSFRKGASDYIVKGNSSRKKVYSQVYKKLTGPIIRMGKEFGFSKFTAIYLATFILMGIVVLIVMNVLPK